MSQQKRNPINITDAFPVGKTILVYRRDGLGEQLGVWSAKVASVDFIRQKINLTISQDWEGADTRGGQYWTELIELSMNDILIPVGKE